MHGKRPVMSRPVETSDTEEQQFQQSQSQQQQQRNLLRSAPSHYPSKRPLQEREFNDVLLNQGDDPFFDDEMMAPGPSRYCSMPAMPLLSRST